MSLFKKIVSKILNQDEQQDDPNVTKLADQLRNADLDYKFAQLFTASGGFFNYCGDEAEALQVLNQIVKIEGIKNVFCCDDDLQNFLNVTKTNFTKNLDINNDAAFITCEFLISYGKIIIMGTVSQIVRDLNEAMMKIKRSGNVRNLTSISGSQSKLDAPTQDQTKLFLILLED